MLVGGLSARSVQHCLSWAEPGFEVALQSNRSYRRAGGCSGSLNCRWHSEMFDMKGHSTQQLEHVCMIVLRHSGRVRDCHPCHSCLWEGSEGRGCNHFYYRSQVVAYDCVHLLSKYPCPSPTQGLVAAVLEGAHHSAYSLTPNLKASRGEAERVALEQQGMRERTVEDLVRCHLDCWRRWGYWCLL